MKRIFLLFVCLTISIISQPIATAQTNTIPAPTDVAAPLADAPKIDPSKVKFLLADCTERIGGFLRQVNGIVARDIDLSVDATAMQLLQMGAAFAKEKCPSAPTPFGLIEVNLRSGDPASFTNASEGFGYSVAQTHYPLPPDAVIAENKDPNQLA